MMKLEEYYRVRSQETNRTEGNQKKKHQEQGGPGGRKKSRAQAGGEGALTGRGSVAWNETSSRNRRNLDP